jgi:hypothetical protein
MSAQETVEIQEIITWILGQSVALGATFPPEGLFENQLQMNVAWEGCCFFLHAVDRLAYREGDERLRAVLCDPANRQMIETFTKMAYTAGGSLSPIDVERRRNISSLNSRQMEYGSAQRLLGNTFNDLRSASWLAAHHVARAAKIPEPDIGIALIHTELLKSLVFMNLAKRIKQLEGLYAR